MEVEIKRFTKEHILPRYESNGAVGFDFWTRKDTHINPGEIALIPANAVIKVPKGYMLMIALRSSTPRKWGVMIPQGVGIVDQDYCGPEDEIKIQVLNFTKEQVYIPEGVRIAQGVFVKVGIVNEWKEVTDEELGKTRGGFGSTG